MRHVELLNCVRLEVTKAFAKVGAETTDSLCETILVRDGFYCGRRFQLDGFSAVWFIAENELKVFNRDGAMIGVSRPCVSVEATALEVA